MKVDLWWLFFDAVARLLPAPNHPVYQIGVPLSADAQVFPHEVESGESAFADCDHVRVPSSQGQVILGLRSGKIFGVKYNLDIYRGSGTKRMRKLQFLLREHSRPHRMRRIVDNGSSMLYRSDEAALFAVYAYMTDILFIHSTDTKVRTMKSTEKAEANKPAEPMPLDAARNSSEFLAVVSCAAGTAHG